MKIYVVDNGGQWTHLEMRLLKYLKVETKIIPNTTPFEEIADLDGLVLSGGAPGGACDVSSMGNNELYIDKATYPILGICAGMQLMCKHFGVEVAPMAQSSGTEVAPDAHGEFGDVVIKVKDHSDLFKGMPDEVTMGVSHSDEVKAVPEGFRLTACSDTCGVEAVACTTRPLFGVQFHPEVKSSGDAGVQLFRNFIDICAEHSE